MHLFPGTMAKATVYLKKLAAAQPDAIAPALKASPLSSDCITELKILSGLVTKAPKDNAAVRRSPGTDFIELIIPMLEATYDEHARNPCDLVLGDVSFEYWAVDSLDLDELIGHHGLLKQQEGVLKTRILMIRYQRGLIYTRTHELIPDFNQLRDWFMEHFLITYTTATAYMSVTSLITRFPLLLKAGLTFNQLRRHLNRIDTYLVAHPRLEEACTVTDGSVDAEIQPDSSTVILRDHAAKDADFELVSGLEEKEEDFPCFEKLTNQSDEH